MIENKSKELETEIKNLIKKGYITNQDQLVRDFANVDKMLKQKEKIQAFFKQCNLEDYRNKIDQTKEEIKKLRREKKIEEAYQLTQLYPNSPIIQGQKLLICFEMNRMDEVEQIAKKFYNHPHIQSILCKLYLKQKQYQEVEKIATRFPQNEVIQSQLCTTYLKREKYKEIEEIAHRFPTYGILQSQLCTVYLRQQKYNKVKEIARRFLDNECIQSQLCTVYLRQGKYNKVKEIAHQFPLYEAIQSQLCTVYLKEGKYGKAKELLKKFPSNKFIKSQLYKYSLEHGNYEVIMEYHTKTLTEMNMFYFREKIYHEYLDHDSMNHLKKIIREDILHIDPWKQTLMLMAIHELIKNKDEMKRLMKDYKRNYSEEKEHLKILKKLISERRVIFDRGLYDDLLEWNHEYDLVKKYIKM